MFKEIVIIVGMPRSGTSWLSQIVESCPSVRFRLSPLFSYALKNTVDINSSSASFLEMFTKAYESNDEFMTQRDNRELGHYPIFQERNSSPSTLVIKMTRYHNLIESLLDKVPNLKIISIVRHPCGAIASWVNTPKEFPANADIMTEWRSGRSRKTGPEEFWGFEDWIKVTRLHTRLENDFPERVKIVKYDDLVDDSIEITKELFSFLKLPYQGQTERFLIDSHTINDTDTHSVFKDPSVKNRWRESLPVSIQDEIIEELKDTDLRRFL